MSIRVPVRESAQTAALSVTHAPIGKGGTNWITRSAPGNTGQLPAYIQNVRNAIMRGGVEESRAHAIAIGRVEDWAGGGGNVGPEVRAASAKAVAELRAMGAKGKLKESLTLAEEYRIRDGCVLAVALLEREIGIDGMVKLAEAPAAPAWSPTLKRVASASSEIERHEVHDGEQHVGTISKRAGFQKEPPRFAAHAVNGERLGDYSLPSQAAALDAVKRHLEEAPARVMPHRDGKYLVAKPSYSGQTSYSEFPNEPAARFGAGLPANASSPEIASKVEALGEALRLDLELLASVGTELPMLRRVKEARRRDPFRGS